MNRFWQTNRANGARKGSGRESPSTVLPARRALAMPFASSGASAMARFTMYPVAGWTRLLEAPYAICGWQIGVMLNIVLRCCRMVKALWQVVWATWPRHGVQEHTVRWPISGKGPPRGMTLFSTSITWWWGCAGSHTHTHTHTHTGRGKMKRKAQYAFQASRNPKKKVPPGDCARGRSP